MRPTTPTRVPAALDRLLQLIGADDVLKDAELCDGAPIKQPETDDVIVIAPSSGEQPGVDVEYVAQPGLGRLAYEEVATIAATISCITGDDEDGSVKGRRDRVVVLFGALQQLLDAHQVEAGCWDSIGLGTAAEWYQVSDEEGVTVAVGFYIVTRSIV